MISQDCTSAEASSSASKCSVYYAMAECIPAIRNALQVLVRSGSPNEKRYAKRIQPVSCFANLSPCAYSKCRNTKVACGLQVLQSPHWTLVTLLLCNAAALEVFIQMSENNHNSPDATMGCCFCAGATHFLGQTAESSSVHCAKCHSRSDCR